MTDGRPTHLDLFSGIGGFALAAQWAGFRTIAFVELDKYCQKVLAKNFLAHADCQSIATPNNGREERKQNIGIALRDFNSSGSPRLFNNIFDFDGTTYRGVDLLTGGFPCQPFSVAGKRRGTSDDRAIWPEMLRVIGEARPAWVLGENVPGIIPMELDNVLADLAGAGYATGVYLLPACTVGAFHRRMRVWIVASDTERNGSPPSQPRSGTQRTTEGANELQQSSGSDSFSNTTSRRLSQSESKSGQSERRGITTAERTFAPDHCRWLPEPIVGRVAHGIPSRVDRIKGLGNAIVPQVAYEILHEIRKLI